MENQDEQTRTEIFEYLDDLRESMVTNMYGAAPYLVEEFGFDKYQARQWLLEWMNTYGERHSQAERNEDGEK